MNEVMVWTFGVASGRNGISFTWTSPFMWYTLNGTSNGVVEMISNSKKPPCAVMLPQE